MNGSLRDSVGIRINSITDKIEVKYYAQKQEILISNWIPKSIRNGLELATILVQYWIREYSMRTPFIREISTVGKKVRCL